MEDRKITLALFKNRTEVTFGKCHFCTTNNEFVDKDHINQCSHISENFKVTDIVAPIIDLKTLWDMDPVTLNNLKEHLTSLRLKLTELSYDIFI